MTYNDQVRRANEAEQRWADEVTRANALAARVRELETDQMLLRRLLWLRHGCETIQLYGDDGEMQCGTCIIDFKRMAPTTIEAVWHRAALGPTRRDAR